MKKLIPTIGAITGLLIGMPCLNAGGPELKIERSVKVSFDSEVGKSYNAYSTTDVAKKKWELLGGPTDGTGDKIVFFYQSDDDQKVFFKVDEANGSGGGDDSVGVDHEWSDTSLRLKKVNGQWGKWVDLKGMKGEDGNYGDPDMKNKIMPAFAANILMMNFEDHYIELYSHTDEADVVDASEVFGAILETKIDKTAKLTWPNGQTDVVINGTWRYSLGDPGVDTPQITFSQKYDNIDHNRYLNWLIGHFSG